MTQLTRDHSVVQELVDAGVVTAEQASSHPKANVVTRALGAASTVAVDTIDVRVDAGDRLLLCSDGLTKALSNEPNRLASHDCLETAADDLVAAALKAGGADNISLVLVRPEADPPPGH